MTDPVKSRRRYRSPVREEQARRTRARVVEAARALFLERGFSATTIVAVAERAEVAPETIYSVYRSKGGLLEAVVRDAVLRDDEPEEVLQRRWVRRLLRLGDARSRLRSFVRHTAATVELTSPLYAILREAGTGSSELADLDQRLRDWRFGGQAEIIGAIADGHALDPGLTIEEAADTFSALASPELHHILTVDRGWSQRRYRRWLERTTEAALLPSSR